MKILRLGLVGFFTTLISGLWLLTHNYHLTQFEDGVTILAYILAMFLFMVITMMGFDDI